MELHKIESILEKYFQGQSSIEEEKELTNYFSSPDVAQHLEQYKPLFSYFSQAKKQKSTQEIRPQTNKRYVAWLSIAASVMVLLGIGMYGYFNFNNATEYNDLGTYDNPEVAFKETQKALTMLSNHVNVGIESVQYVKEYQNSKNLIFKQ